MRMLDDDDLRQKGIKFSRQHRQRLIKAKLFPAPVKIGANRNVWPESEIDAWLRDRIAARDERVAPRPADAALPT